MDKKYDTSSPKRKAPRSSRGGCARKCHVREACGTFLMYGMLQKIAWVNIAKIKQFRQAWKLPELEIGFPCRKAVFMV